MTCHNRHCSYVPPRGCPTTDGCPPGVCPDFVIRRHDTMPTFKVGVEDCDGPLDTTGLVLEASMWAKGRLKAALAPSDNYFALADNIGFEQIMVGDIIIFDRPRLPEKMLVLGFDEVNSLVEVQRGYHGTTPQAWKKGTRLRIMKFTGAPAQTEMVYQDLLQVDGTTVNTLTDSLLVYAWGQYDTCLPGCYYLEFKLLKMTEASLTSTPVTAPSYPPGSLYGPLGPYVLPGHPYEPGMYEVPGSDKPPSEPLTNQHNLKVSALSLDADDGTCASNVPASFTDPNLTPADFGCGLAPGVEWVRRFPVNGEGFLIQVTESPTAEV